MAETPKAPIDAEDFIPDPADADGDDTRIDPSSAEQQAREAGSGTTGHEVSPTPNDDITLTGRDKK